MLENGKLNNTIEDFDYKNSKQEEPPEYITTPPPETLDNFELIRERQDNADL